MTTLCLRCETLFGECRPLAHRPCNCGQQVCEMAKPSKAAPAAAVVVRTSTQEVFIAPIQVVDFYPEHGQP